MKLSSLAIERDLRQQVRRELRGSQLLWNEYRHHRTRWWRRDRNFQTVFGPVCVLAILFLVVVRSGRPLALLSIVALYASGTALFRCTTYYARVLRGYDRAVLFTLPVTDDDYLQHEFRVFFRSWARAFAVFVFAYGAYAAAYGNVWRDLGILLLAATLQTLTGLCIGAAIVAYKPKWAGGSVIVPFYGLIIACLYVPEDGLQFLWSATLTTPAGWVAHGFAALVGRADSIERFWLVPAFVMSAALPIALRRLRSRLLSELVSTGDAFEPALASDSDEDQERLPVTEPDGAVHLLPADFQMVKLFESADWRYLGWIERMVAAWLSARQKVVAEFMLGNDLGTWSKRWRNAAILTGVGSAFTLAAPMIPAWILFLPMLIAGIMSAPILGGSWIGIKSSFSSGFVLPAYSAFPLGYGEISSTMLKTNLIRALTWMPMAIVYAAALARRSGHSFLYGGGIGLDVVLVLLALQPVMVAGHFSSGTNDTRQINWHTVVFFGCGLMALVVMLIATLMMFIVPTVLIQAAAIGLMFTMSAAAWAAYKRLFERGRIDLLSRPHV